MIPDTLLQEFQLDPDIIHINHAAMGPWPQRTVAVIERFARENAKQAGMGYASWLDTEHQLRKHMAKLVGAPDANDLAIVKNTSEALSFVAYGLNWQDGDNIVISNEEFPSNRVVWESLAQYGVQVRYADLWQDESPEQSMINLVDENTRLLAVSSVQFRTGLRMDLKALGQMCRERDILFCIDAIQSLGAVEFDVKSYQADFVMADGHKWMLAPEGVGLFYCRPELRDTLELKQYGWHMLDDFLNFDQSTWQAANNAQRFECGSPNMMGIHALHASLSLLHEVGLDQVEAQVMKNTQYLMEGLAVSGDYEFVTPTEPSRRAGIVVVRHRNADTAAIYQYLVKNRVYCALRGGNLRFSPHFYNSTETMDRLLAMLQAYQG